MGYVIPRRNILLIWNFNIPFFFLIKKIDSMMIFHIVLIPREEEQRENVSPWESFILIDCNKEMDMEKHCIAVVGLFQQYMVDTQTWIEGERLRYVGCKLQPQLRTKLIKNVCDAVVKDDHIGAAVGKRIILASLFTRWPRYKIQNYQDAMAICRWYGNPHLLVTFTANPKWLEIQYMLKSYRRRKT